MFIKAKSEPDISDNVEHVIASLPVIVKLIDAEDDVAAVRARVTVGALVSGNVVDVVVVDVVVVVSLLPELLLGAVVVTVGGATVVVVEVVVGKVEIVVVAGAANHFTGVFSHQHTPVRGHRNTPESLSAHARISLVEVGRASRVPLNGH
jgi:hypothetical protein